MAEEKGEHIYLQMICLRQLIRGTGLKRFLSAVFMDLFPGQREQAALGISQGITLPEHPRTDPTQFLRVWDSHWELHTAPNNLSTAPGENKSGSHPGVATQSSNTTHTEEVFREFWNVLSWKGGCAGWAEELRFAGVWIKSKSKFCCCCCPFSGRTWSSRDVEAP